MKPKPVSESRSPGYPTRREVLAGAASFALASLTGCRFFSREADPPEVEAKPIHDAPIEAAPPKVEPRSISVAPIFEHGEGVGAGGCVVVSPPAFLSEEEAMPILREELGRHGIELQHGGTLEGVLVPDSPRHPRTRDPFGSGMGTAETPEAARPLPLDGYDSKKKIAVEFVGITDYYALGGEDDGSTAVCLPYKSTAEWLVAEARQNGTGGVYLGVFYDPAAPTSPDTWPEPCHDWKARRERGIAASGELLRRQAQDFVAWLQEQKAI